METNDKIAIVKQMIADLEKKNYLDSLNVADIDSLNQELNTLTQNNLSN